MFEAFASDDGASVLVNFNKGNGDFKLTYRWKKGYGNGEFDDITKVDFYAKCKAVIVLADVQDFKDTVYEIVKTQILNEFKNNNIEVLEGDKTALNYYTIKSARKSLYACLNWNDLTNFYNSNKTKYSKTLAWGGSHGIGFSKKDSKNSCNHFKKKYNHNNCNCELIDENNVNSLKVPQNVIAKLNIKDNSNKNKEIAKKIVGYYEGDLRYPDGTLPVYSEIYLNNNILEGKYYFKDFDGENMVGNLSSFELIGKNSFNIKWEDKYNNGWLKVILVGDDFEGKFGVRANERSGYWSGYKVSPSVFNREKENLFGDQNKKNQETNIEIVKDTDGPIIEINKEFTADQNFTANIKGLVRDDNEIALVSIDGENVSINNGKFSSSIYVPPKGKNIEVVAIDKNGNKSIEIISVIRGEIAIVKNTYDFLDPRKIKVKTNNNSVALIIGIEKYQNTFTAPFAENDALAFNDFAHTSLGVPVKNIKLLTNDDAGRTNTIKTLAQWLPKVVSENKTDIYIFYSGHGLASEDGSDLYLLPADGDPELLEDSTILRNQLFERIAKLNPKSVTVFLDTCYSGGTRSDEILVASRPIFIEAEEQDVPVNFTIFSASAGKETAKVLNEAEHGLFSYYMMKGLEGEADGNNDNKITNGELHAFINKNVSRQANQTPQLNGDPEKILLQW